MGQVRLYKHYFRACIQKISKSFAPWKAQQKDTLIWFWNILALKGGITLMSEKLKALWEVAIIPHLKHPYRIWFTSKTQLLLKKALFLVIWEILSNGAVINEPLRTLWPELRASQLRAQSQVELVRHLEKQYPQHSSSADKEKLQRTFWKVPITHLTELLKG